MYFYQTLKVISPVYNYKSLCSGLKVLGNFDIIAYNFFLRFKTVQTGEYFFKKNSSQGPTGEVDLVEGQNFKLSLKKEDFEQGDENMVYVDYRNLTKTVKKSSKIFMDDGLIALRVTEIGEDHVMTVVENSGKLGSKKGVNLPEAIVDLPAVSEKDKADIMFGVQNGVRITVQNNARQYFLGY